MRKRILKFSIVFLLSCLMLPDAVLAGNGTALRERVSSNLAPQLVVKDDSFKINFPAETENENLLPVYDHYQQQIGFKPRSSIHREGDFHRGVQAYIVRETEDGKIQVLRQKRSDKVDIAKGKYDQSVATQELPQDEGDSENTLKRGLFQELGIREDEIEIARVGAEGWLRVYKKYSEDANLYNREFISLFMVKLKTSRQIQCDNPKIEEIEWVNWEDYVSDLLANKNKYTKTGSFYVLDPLMRDATEEALNAFMKGKELSALPVRRVCFYSYDDGYDISSYINWENEPVINTFDNQTGEIKTFKDVISFNYVEGKNVEHVKIILISKDLSVSVWENGRITFLGKQGDENSLRSVEAVMARFNNIVQEMEQTGLSRSERNIVEDTKTRFTHTLNLLRAKILAGMLKIPDLSMDEQGQFQIKGDALAGDIEILAFPGTFDPPHFAHIDRLLHALSYAVEADMSKSKTVISFFTPVGENAPSPGGTDGWKSNKSGSVIRHEMSKIMTDIFSPVIQTSMMSLLYPADYGTRNALRLAEKVQEFHAPGAGTITFTVVCGSDTFEQWQKNFDFLFSDFKRKNPQIKLRIIVFNNPNEKLAGSILPVSKVPITFFSDLMPLNDYSTGYHSAVFRMENNFNLLPVSLRSYIKNHQLYNSGEEAQRKVFEGFRIREMVGASI